MMKRALILFFAILSFAAPVAAVQTETVDVNGEHKVVHSRLAPVVVHRAFPPFKGQHVYQGRRR